MLDLPLRHVKDRVFDPICSAIPSAVTPSQLTGLAFISGLCSCYTTATGGSVFSSVSFWSLNRVLDCLDGAVARRRQQTSDLGGFLDLLGDFIVYSLIPIACVMSPRSPSAGEGAWLAVALLEAAIHINNFVLFYVAAVVEKNKKKAVEKETETAKDEQRQRELTSVVMMPALVEGFESGTIFTMMICRPQLIAWLSTVMAVLVFVGTSQRVVKLIRVLR